MWIINFFERLFDMFIGTSIFSPDVEMSLGQIPYNPPAWFNQTGKALDLAILGEAYFPIRFHGQLYYTRSGRLFINNRGRLAHHDGGVLDIPFLMPKQIKKIQIDNDGNIFVTLPRQESAVNIGKIKLVKFENPTGLYFYKNDFLLPTNQSGKAIGVNDLSQESPVILQGFYEDQKRGVKKIMNSLLSEFTGRPSKKNGLSRVEVIDNLSL